MKRKEDPILLEIRELVYSFLSTSFLNLPAAEQVATILQKHLFDEFPLEIDWEEYEKGLGLLRTWSKENETVDPEQVLSSLQEDYSTLFIGPGHLLAPPWESVYLTEDKLTFGEPTFAVREFYLRHGLQYSRKNSEPDDHFGLELEFMSRLVSKQRQKLDEGLQEEAIQLAKEQLLFLQEHPCKWVDDFTQNITDNACTLYFRGLALIAKSYVTWDCKQLEISMKYS